LTAAVGIPDDVKGEAIVCFVVFRPEAKNVAGLAERLLEDLGATFGKPMKPGAVHAVPPYRRRGAARPCAGCSPRRTSGRNLAI
jgi:acyl-CoA synthetase (AMP-forming)/AMP-acid ligase II